MRTSASAVLTSSKPFDVEDAVGPDGSSMRATEKGQERLHRRGLLVFFVIAFAWLAFDQLTKAMLAGHDPGERLYASRLGVLDIVVVHNTGGAWGIFSGSTSVLGVVSLVVCAVILLYVLLWAKRIPLVGYIGLGLVFAGGIGNAIDRFLNGYVVDMLSFAFMDFPVFNVADIGVTVGLVLFILSLLVQDGEVEDGSTGKPCDPT